MNNLNLNPAKKANKSLFTRTLYEDCGNKYWCYQKNTIDHDGNPWKSGHYCYNCKNELFFKWNDPHYKNDPPFRVHGQFLKSVERVNEYGRNQTISYFNALCCKCWKKRVDDPVNKGNEIFKFDCQVFIKEKIINATKSIEIHNKIINDCEELKENLNRMRKSENIVDKTFKDYLISEFMRGLRKRQDSDRQSRIKEENNLKLYQEWEIKWNKMFENHV